MKATHGFRFPAPPLIYVKSIGGQERTAETHREMRGKVFNRRPGATEERAQELATRFARWA